MTFIRLQSAIAADPAVSSKGSSSLGTPMSANP